MLAASGFLVTAALVTVVIIPPLDSVLSKSPATVLRYPCVPCRAPDVCQIYHVTTGRARRNSEASLPKLFIPIFCLLPVEASPRLPRYSAAALHSCSPSQQLTGEATYSKWSVPAHEPVTHPSLHPTGQGSSPACVCDLPFLPASPICF